MRIYSLIILGLGLLGLLTLLASILWGRLTQEVPTIVMWVCLGSLAGFGIGTFGLGVVMLDAYANPWAMFDNTGAKVTEAYK